MRLKIDDTSVPYSMVKCVVFMEFPSNASPLDVASQTPGPTSVGQ